MAKISREKVEEKYCTACKRTLAREAFGRDDKTSTGLTYYCRKCAAKKCRDRKDRLEGRGKYSRKGMCTGVRNPILDQNVPYVSKRRWE